MAHEMTGTDTPETPDHAATTATVSVPDKPALEGLEEKYAAQWRENGTYAFREDTDRESVYSIDTPPPTASGSLHVGHMFSYTQTLSLIHISEPTRREWLSRMPSSA